MIGLTTVEVNKSLFNITENKKLELYTDTFD